ncbi:MAG: hypothetical protein ACOX6E_07310 [Syntrophomonadaceae bacterium]|jgi:uncharacterized protein with ATP-grasp and redox domains
MKHSIDCLPCLLQQTVRTAKKHLSDESARQNNLILLQEKLVNK